MHLFKLICRIRLLQAQILRLIYAWYLHSTVAETVLHNPQCRPRYIGTMATIKTQWLTATSVGQVSPVSDVRTTISETKCGSSTFCIVNTKMILAHICKIWFVLSIEELKIKLFAPELIKNIWILHKIVRLIQFSEIDPGQPLIQQATDPWDLGTLHGPHQWKIAHQTDDRGKTKEQFWWQYRYQYWYWSRISIIQ